MRSCVALSHTYVSGEDCMRNLSPLKLDHACVYVVYIDAYDTSKHATGGVGVVVIDEVAGAGVVVRAALVDEVVRAALVDEVDVALVDEVVGAGVVLVVLAKGARRRRRDAAGNAAVDHEAVNPSNSVKELVNT